MKLIESRQTFELESPLGEPNIKWGNEKYYIDRLQENGKIIWFGQGVNWVKKDNESWTVLGEDENVKPTLHIKGENGMGDYFEYPEGRQIWIPCEEPIYETLYKKLLHD